MTRAEEVAAMSDEELGAALAKALGWKVFDDFSAEQDNGMTWGHGDLCTMGDGMLAVIRALGEKDFCCVKLGADHAYCYDAIVMLDKEHTANILVTNESAPRAVAEAALLALERTTGEKGEKP